MKVAIIGANGRVGHLVVKEALSRKIEVTAVVRNKASITDNIAIIAKDIMSLTAQDLAQFDAVVSALGIWEPSQFDQFISTTQHLCDLLAKTNTRLLIVGGAGSLFTDATHTKQLYQTDDFPAAYLPLATAMAKQLAYLRTRQDVKWTYFSPAGIFDAEGSRTEKFTIGGEEALTNSKGESYISYADYAIAMVDELQTAKHVQQRFSIIGQ